jgi:ATP-dependent Clp protease ATP-binding subunit ClpC
VVLFNTLSREDIHKIIDIELKGLYDRVNTLGFEIKLSEEAKDYVLDKGYDIQYGARPLKRAIQKYLEDPMAETIIKSALVEGDIMLVDFDSDTEEITVGIQKKTGVLPKAKKELPDSKKELPDAGEEKTKDNKEESSSKKKKA